MSLFWPKVKATTQRGTYVLPPITPTLSSYADINLSRAETSLQKVAVWTSVDLIASLASELPVDVTRGLGPDKVKLPDGHPWLDDPGGDGQGREDWIYQLLVSWLLRGNGWGVIQARNLRGDQFPTAIQWRNPDQVSVTVADGKATVYDDKGEIPESRLFHRRVYPSPGCYEGMSPIAHHASTIGLGLSLTQFGRQFFTDGAHPSGMLVNSEVDLDQKQVDTARARFMAALRGNREPAVLGRGWQYQAIGIAPEESQFLETNQFTSAECARIFGPGIAEILGYPTGGSMTYSNVQARTTGLLVYALSKWLRRVDRVLTAMLPRGQFARLNRDALLESTTLERFQVHEIALRNRIRNVNQVLAIEDEPPVPWGDEPNQTPGAAPAAAPADQQPADQPADGGSNQ